MQYLESILLYYHAKNPAIRSFLENKDPTPLFLYDIETTAQALILLYRIKKQQYKELLEEIPFIEYNQLLLEVFNPLKWNEIEKYDRCPANPVLNEMLLAIFLNENLHPNNMYNLALYLLNTCPKEFRYIILTRYLYYKLQFTKP
jgi:hypothetical protein